MSFSIQDLTRTNTGIDNTPDSEALQNLNDLNDLLSYLNNNIGAISILSAFRSDAVNRAVGGADGSYHTLGIAADITPLNQSLNDYYAKLISNPSIRNMMGEIALKPAQNAIHVSLPTDTKQGVIMIVNDAGQYIKKSLDDALAYVGANPIKSAGLALALALGLFLFFRLRSKG